MAPLPTIGNCVRVTLNWNTSQGVTPRNVMHIITASDSGSDIGEAMQEAWQANPDCFQTVQSGFTLVSLSILPLDGTAPTFEYTMEAPFIVGGGDGDIIPQAAAVLSLRSNQRGPRGRGRLFLGPIGENVLEDGVIGASYRASAISSWEGFDDDLAASPIAGSVGVASYAHSDVHGVATWSMRAPSGTIKKRNQQLV